jgi:putative ABC transport system permease protein
MLKNYLRLAVRNLRRSATYSAINISGLALGIACALLIISFITYHTGFDNFHSHSDRIYRFVTEQHRDNVSYAPAVPPAFGKTFREDYTFGETVGRLYTSTGALITIQDEKEVKKFREDVAFADPEFFDIFNFPLAHGDNRTALVEPNTAVISETIARKYFGDESPLEKIIRLDNRIDFRITGILGDIPTKSDFRSGIFLSYATIGQLNAWYAADDAWGGITTDLQTFVRLRPGVNPREVEAVLPAYVKKFRAESKNVHHYKLQPLGEIHFDSRYGGVMDRGILIVLSVIGAFLVFTACLNFINLATAQAVNRSKEVGVRKTLGSARSQLFWQFASETGLIVVLATFVAVAIAYSVLPYLNELFNNRVKFELLSDARLLLLLPVLMMAVTFLSCTYPGLVLSGFKPVIALKGRLTGRGTGNFNLRRTLITIQFTISHVLLIGLIVIVFQIRYLKKADLGFDQTGVVLIPAGSNDMKMKTLKARFQQIPAVESVTACFAAASSDSWWGNSITYENRTEGEDFAVSFKGGDEDFVNTFGLKLIAGRNLTPADTVREFLVNETLVEKLNLTPEEILGKNIAAGAWSGPVVGVLKDFHDAPLRLEIHPLYVTTSMENYHLYAVKINLGNSRETLKALEAAWTSTYPELIYEYDFMDNVTAEFYQTEETILDLIQGFAFIALFIGCMGLYGMASYMAIQKTKEIGIRKVLGSSLSQILWIFGKEFSRLILIAFLLAAPLGWWLMSEWLEQYKFHVPMSAWIFILEMAVIAFVVLLTVGYQSARSALANPVKSLRSE